MNRKIIFIFFSVAIFMLYPVFCAEMPTNIIDGHLHYLDFTQKTDGFDKLVKKMDETGVSGAVVFGMAMAK